MPGCSRLVSTSASELSCRCDLLRAWNDRNFDLSTTFTARRSPVFTCSPTCTLLKKPLPSTSLRSQLSCTHRSDTVWLGAGPLEAPALHGAAGCTAGKRAGGRVAALAGVATAARPWMTKRNTTVGGCLASRACVQRETTSPCCSVRVSPFLMRWSLMKLPLAPSCSKKKWRGPPTSEQ